MRALKVFAPITLILAGASFATPERSVELAADIPSFSTVPVTIPEATWESSTTTASSTPSTVPTAGTVVKRVPTTRPPASSTTPRRASSAVPSTTTPPPTNQPFPTTPPMYKLLMGDVRWNPCKPVTWTIDESHNPQNRSTENHAKAVQRMSEATGLVFQQVAFGGSADITFKWRPINYQGSIGYGSAHKGADGFRTNGVVIIDPARTEATYGLLLHELGHVIGLDHVYSLSDVMGNHRLPDLGQGDLQGLRIMGKQEGECL